MPYGGAFARRTWRGGLLSIEVFLQGFVIFPWVLQNIPSNECLNIYGDSLQETALLDN